MTTASSPISTALKSSAARLPRLRNGTRWPRQSAPNVLAIHGLNDSASSTDFLMLAELVENKVLGLTNHYFSTPSPNAVNGAGTFALVDNLKFTPGRGWFDTTNLSITITSATP